MLGSGVGFVVGIIEGGAISARWVEGRSFGYLLWLIGALIGGLIASPFGMFIGAGIGACIDALLGRSEASLKERKQTKLQERALTALQERKWDQAVISLTEIIRQNPWQIQAYHQRSFAYLGLNEFERAIEDCNRVIKTDLTPITRSEPVPPYVADAYVHRGVAFARMGQHDKAIADFTDAIHLAPDVPTAYEQRAQSYRATGDTKAAATDERTANDLVGRHFQPRV
jgi:tetratricopeptide (TPR) repeat protein